MKSYHEIQIGYFMIIAMGLGILACIGLHLLEPEGFSITILSILCGTFLFVGLLFYRLQTTINDELIKISYGIGLLNFSFPISTIRAVNEIKTPWYFGWGIRFTPKGRLYNIQGSKAVALDLEEDGHKRTIMIGTKTPDTFIQALSKNKI